jgi:NAD-dependent deacetylase
MTPAISRLQEMLHGSRRAVVFTGAGISTESGIPDYRSPGGLWSRYRPIDFEAFVTSEDARREYWRRKFDTHDAVMQAKPNRGHRTIAELVRRDKIIAVITQNVDGLHQASGIPRDTIIELHGNTTYAHCLSCGAVYDLEPIRQRFLADQAVPVCATCGGLVKTATISFGQAMPEEAMRRAVAAAETCDLFLAIGSSLTVYSAAGLPRVAKQAGAALVIMNRDQTDLDDSADLVIHAEIGPTLEAIIGGTSSR